jgi:hypothetical protein
MHRRQSRRVLIGWLAAVAAALATLTVAAVGGAAEQSKCATLPSGGNVCLQVDNNPNPVSASTSSSTSFLRNDVVITNDSGQTVTQPTYTLDTAASTLAVYTPALPSGCSYSAASHLVTCLLPQMPNGATASLTIWLTAPTTTGDAGSLRSILTFKESGSPDPGRVSSVEPIDEPIDVTTTAEAAVALVPENTDVQVSIAKNGQTGNANIPAQHFSTSASLSFTPTTVIPFVCPPKEVCRTGDWVAATIPGTFDPPLQFTLSWPSAEKKQNGANFAIFYRSDAGVVSTVKTRCDATFSVLPCVTNIVVTKNGVRATFVTRTNGHMR